jgi:hypothetical protein
LAISSGVTSEVPSVMDATACRLLVIPMRWAMSTVFSGPASTESCAYTTLSEMVVAAATLSMPPGPSPFTTHGSAP